MTGMDFYHCDIPAHLRELLRTDAMQRLEDVGMNCGCEYTSFPRFQGLAPYSRLEHSLGVGLIVWHFTGSIAQSSAGMLHDIATPVFAHVIDFLRGDHVRQESTEDGTRQRIEEDGQIQQILAEFGLSTDDVCDYHRYPIADNDTPQLSADRLEYTLGNAVNYGFASRESVAELYRDLTVGTNEFGEEELMFRSLSAALAFGNLSLDCSEIYIADADRFAMQALAQLLKDALKDSVISLSDLHTTEPEVLKKLCADETYRAKWDAFRSYRRMERSDAPIPGWLQIDAKKRFIDPCVVSLGRLAALDSAYRARIEEFKARSLFYYVQGFRSTSDTGRGYQT